MLVQSDAKSGARGTLWITINLTARIVSVGLLKNNVYDNNL